MTKIRNAQYILFLLVVLLVIACKKDANVVITTPPAIDSSAMIKYMGSFANGPYGAVAGKVQILKQDSAHILKLRDFFSSSGPDLHVYLSKEIQPVNYIDLGTLRSRTGDQAYSIPGSPDFTQYKYALIHCQAYNHLFGSAELR
jgi:hypothetical protein